VHRLRLLLAILIFSAFCLVFGILWMEIICLQALTLVTLLLLCLMQLGWRKTWKQLKLIAPFALSLLLMYGILVLKVQQPDIFPAQGRDQDFADKGALTAAVGAFELISAKALSGNSLLSELSGGQKVILMACLAVFSPARRICFIDLEHSLDPLRHEVVMELIEGSGKETCFRDPA